MITDDKELVSGWVANRIGKDKFHLPYEALGYVGADGSVIAGFVFNNYTRNDIEVSLAADRLPRALLKRVYFYIVHELECRRATFRTRSDNHAAQKALERLGAKLEGRQRLYFGDCDALVYGIMKEDFPFEHS